MINDIVILENVIPKSYQDAIEANLLGEMMVPWLLLNDISYGDANQLNQTNTGFVHPLKVDNQIKSHIFNFVLPMVFSSLEHIKFQYRDTLMARSFLQFPKPKTSANNPHIDLPIPHLVCLYYVNDCDGNTIVYNETLDTVKEQDVGITNFTIKQEISPKKGQVLLFNGKYYHSSSNPTQNKRCIINFDIV